MINFQDFHCILAYIFEYFCNFSLKSNIYVLSKTSFHYGLWSMKGGMLGYLKYPSYPYLCCVTDHNLKSCTLCNSLSVRSSCQVFCAHLAFFGRSYCYLVAKGSCCDVLELIFTQPSIGKADLFRLFTLPLATVMRLHNIHHY